MSKKILGKRTALGLMLLLACVNMSFSLGGRGIYQNFDSVKVLIIHDVDLTGHPSMESIFTNTQKFDITILNEGMSNESVLTQAIVVTGQELMDIALEEYYTNAGIMISNAMKNIGEEIATVYGENNRCFSEIEILDPVSGVYNLRSYINSHPELQEGALFILKLTRETVHKKVDTGFYSSGGYTYSTSKQWNSEVIQGDFYLYNNGSRKKVLKDVEVLPIDQPNFALGKVLWKTVIQMMMDLSIPQMTFDATDVLNDLGYITKHVMNLNLSYSVNMTFQNDFNIGIADVIQDIYENGAGEIHLLSTSVIESLTMHNINANQMFRLRGSLIGGYGLNWSFYKADLNAESMKIHNDWHRDSHIYYSINDYMLNLIIGLDFTSKNQKSTHLFTIEPGFGLATMKYYENYTPLSTGTLVENTYRVNSLIYGIDMKYSWIINLGDYKTYDKNWTVTFGLVWGSVMSLDSFKNSDGQYMVHDTASHSIKFSDSSDNGFNYMDMRMGAFISVGIGK